MSTRPSILLIPSCGIEPVDHLSSKDTLIRLMHGLAEWQSRQYDLILVTGGVFNPRFVQTRPAGQLMKDWLVAMGIREDIILTENKSLDTFENVKYGIEVLQDNNAWPADITVVTQWQHAVRFATTFLLGYKIKIRLCPAHYPISTKTALNEYFFMAYHLFDPKGNGLLAKHNRALRREAAASL